MQVGTNLFYKTTLMQFVSNQCSLSFPEWQSARKVYSSYNLKHCCGIQPTQITLIVDMVLTLMHVMEK